MVIKLNKAIYQPKSYSFVAAIIFHEILMGLTLLITYKYFETKRSSKIAPKDIANPNQHPTPSNHLKDTQTTNQDFFSKIFTTKVIIFLAVFKVVPYIQLLLSFIGEMIAELFGSNLVVLLFCLVYPVTMGAMQFVNSAINDGYKLELDMLAETSSLFFASIPYSIIYLNLEVEWFAYTVLGIKVFYKVFGYVVVPTIRYCRKKRSKVSGKGRIGRLGRLGMAEAFEGAEGFKKEEEDSKSVPSVVLESIEEDEEAQEDENDEKISKNKNYGLRLFDQESESKKKKNSLKESLEDSVRSIDSRYRKEFLTKPKIDLNASNSPKKVKKWNLGLQRGSEVTQQSKKEPKSSSPSAINLTKNLKKPRSFNLRKKGLRFSFNNNSSRMQSSSRMSLNRTPESIEIVEPSTLTKSPPMTSTIREDPNPLNLRISEVLSPSGAPEINKKEKTVILGSQVKRRNQKRSTIQTMIFENFKPQKLEEEKLFSLKFFILQIFDITTNISITGLVLLNNHLIYDLCGTNDPTKKFDPNFVVNIIVRANVRKN